MRAILSSVSVCVVLLVRLVADTTLALDLCSFSSSAVDLGGVCGGDGIPCSASSSDREGSELMEAFNFSSNFSEGFLGDDVGVVSTVTFVFRLDCFPPFASSGSKESGSVG